MLLLVAAAMLSTSCGERAEFNCGAFEGDGWVAPDGCACIGPEGGSSYVNDDGDAFSVCMHRPDARTVSSTVVVVEPGSVTMRYRAGWPCERPPVHETVLVP